MKQAQEADEILPKIFHFSLLIDVGTAEGEQVADGTGPLPRDLVKQSDALPKP